MLKRNLRSYDCRILVVYKAVEVSKSLVLGNFASEVVEHVLRQTLAEELIVLSLVLKLDVLSKLNEDSGIVLAAEECVAIVRILSKLLVYVGVVGELSLVLNELGADVLVSGECVEYVCEASRGYSEPSAASSHVPPQK